MESLRRLAGKVAHDLNNILTTIMGYVDLLRIEKSLDESSREFVQEIKQSTEKAAALTQRLLIFSRNELTKPAVINLNELLTGLEDRLRSLLGERIDFQLILGGDVPAVQTDYIRMEQAVVSIVANSFDAMPGGGNLEIRTQSFILDDELASKLELRPGAYALIEISDTGIGIAEEDYRRIYEPFFTTKEDTEKPGLGLSMAYTTILQSNGNLECISKKGEGTTFRIFLPARERISQG